MGRSSTTFVKQPKPKRDGSVHVRGIAREVKTRFKATCAGREEPMNVVLETLMRLYISNPGVYADNVRATRNARRDGRSWSVE